MRYSNSMTYEASAAAVYAMLTDERFQAQRANAGNPEHAEAVVTAGPGDGATVDVVRRMAVDLPPLIGKLTGGRVTLRETVRWPDGEQQGAGGRAGALSASMEGQPGGVHGTLRITESGGTTTVALDGDISVKVPLVGGKIERYVAEMLDKLMRKEHELGRAWLAEAAGRTA